MNLDELDYSAIESKYGKLSKKKKKRIARTLQLGKSVLYVPDFNKPPTMKCHYLNNFAVWTDLNDNRKIVKTFENQRAKSQNRDENTFAIKKPIRLNDRDGQHVLGRRMGRVITKKEILNCLANGIHVKNFSKQIRPNADPYVFYDRYYFFDDVGVVASETKNYINVRTIYRTTAIADYGFLEVVPDLVNELKLNDESYAQFTIINNTARLKFLQTKEHQEMMILTSTLNGKNPYIQGEKLKTFREDIARNGVLDEATMKVIEKRCELGDIEYTHTTTGNDSPSIADFNLSLAQNYAVEFVFETSSPDGIDKFQKQTLLEYGLILEKYPHDLDIIVDAKKEKTFARIRFDMSTFSAAENPWAIRRKNNKNVID